MTWRSRRIRTCNPRSGKLGVVCRFFKSPQPVMGHLAAAPVIPPEAGREVIHPTGT
jgi:hypothetical protein